MLVSILISTLPDPRVPYALCSLLKEEPADLAEAYKSAYGNADLVAQAAEHLAEGKLASEEVILFCTGAPIAVVAARLVFAASFVKLRVIFLEEADERHFADLEAHFAEVPRDLI